MKYHSSADCIKTIKKLLQTGPDSFQSGWTATWFVFKEAFFLGINCQWLEIIGMLSTQKLSNRHFVLHSFDWLMFFVVVQQKYQQSQYFYCSLTVKGTKENYCVYRRSYSVVHCLATLFWVNQC